MGLFQALSRRVIHEWVAWRLVEQDFVDPNGGSFSRTFVESPGVVVVAAIDESDQIVMVRQYRPALDMMLWELPAGMRDVDGESPLDCAKRELLEETGFSAVNWQGLGQIAQSPGSSNSIAELFLARGLEPGMPCPHGPEEEHVVIRSVPLIDAVEMVLNGEVINSLAIIGILRAERLVRG
jgi:ADP-ribose pyrophosphatase